MIPELTLTGTPDERGRAHGEELRDLIAITLDRWFEVLADRTDPRAFTENIFHTSGFRQAAAEHTPGFLEEVAGIAEGSGQPVEAIFAWQLIDECWWYLDDLTGELTPHEACSAMAINDGDKGIVAQTQDLYRHFDGSQVLLRYVEADGFEVLAPSAAGLLAYNGVNSAGVGVCITTLSQLSHQTAGVASGFIVPHLLRCRTVDEAVTWLQQTPLASGNSWTIGARDRSVVMEVSATTKAIVDDGSRALHTNHPLAIKPDWDNPRFGTSPARLHRLEATISPAMSVSEVADVYREAPICQSRSGDGEEVSVMTTIFELADTPRCHVAAGPLDSEELVTYDFTTSTQGQP